MGQGLFPELARGRSHGTFTPLLALSYRLSRTPSRSTTAISTSIDARANQVSARYVELPIYRSCDTQAQGFSFTGAMDASFSSKYIRGSVAASFTEFTL